MNKLMMTVLISAALVPSMILARQGADDMFEGGHTSAGHTGATWTGMTHTGMVKPPMGTGAMMNGELQALHMAMGKLSSTDKEALVKMIKEYLTSKGITVEAIKEVRKEVKEARKDAREEMKDIRKNTRETLKAKRDELKNKIKDIRKGTGTTMSGTTL